MLILYFKFRYVFGDLYAGAIWVGEETPENSGNYTTSKVPFSCARDSPLECASVPGSPLPSLGYIFSYGEDNKKDLYLLASSGVYRVVRPSRCSYSCPKESVTAASTPGPSPSSPSFASRSNSPYNSLLLIFSSLLLVLL